MLIIIVWLKNNLNYLYDLLFYLELYYLIALGAYTLKLYKLQKIVDNLIEALNKKNKY